MKTISDIKSESASLHPAVEHWFLDQISELAEVRIRQRQRELAQPGLREGIYADHDLVYRP